MKAAVDAHRPGDIDWITFVGSGKPTLHASLGRMIREVKTPTEVPVAVITNGSLLYQGEVQQEPAAADAVLPSSVTHNRKDARLSSAEAADEGLGVWRTKVRSRRWAARGE